MTSNEIVQQSCVFLPIRTCDRLNSVVAFDGEVNYLMGKVSLNSQIHKGQKNTLIWCGQLPLTNIIVIKDIPY